MVVAIVVIVVAGLFVVVRDGAHVSAFVLVALLWDSLLLDTATNCETTRDG